VKKGVQNWREKRRITAGSCIRTWEQEPWGTTKRGDRLPRKRGPPEREGSRAYLRRDDGKPLDEEGLRNPLRRRGPLQGGEAVLGGDRQETSIQSRPKMGHRLLWMGGRPCRRFRDKGNQTQTCRETARHCYFGNGTARGISDRKREKGSTTQQGFGERS